MKKLITFVCAVLWTSATVWADDLTYTFPMSVFGTSDLSDSEGGGFVSAYSSGYCYFSCDADGNPTVSAEEVSGAVLVYENNNNKAQYKYNSGSAYLQTGNNSSSSGIYFVVNVPSAYTYASVSVDFSSTTASEDNTQRYIVLSSVAAKPTDSGADANFLCNPVYNIGGVNSASEHATLSADNLTEKTIYVLCSKSVRYYSVTVSFYDEQKEVASESSHEGEATITDDGDSKVELSEEDLIGTILSGDPTYITFSSGGDFTIRYTEGGETVTVNAYAEKDRTIVITEDTSLESFVLSAEFDASGSQDVTWTVYTTAYTAPKENSDSAIATAGGAELTLDDLIYEVPEEDVTYIVFTAETEFTVSYSDDTETVSVTGTSLTIEVTETVDLTSFVLTAASDTEVAWTVHTDELPEPELTGVTYEYIFDNEIMPGLAGVEGILNGDSDVKDITIYFAKNSASTDASNGDGILSWTTSKTDKTGSKVLTDNPSTDEVYKSAMTTGAQTQYVNEELGAYFTVTCPDDYNGYYMQVRATFYSNTDNGDRVVAISEEAVAYSTSGTYLGSATSTGKSDMKVAAGTKQMEKGESLYVLCSANVGYYEVMVIFSEQALDSGTESGDGGDGNEGGGESDAISSISSDTVVEVARYNILGQKIEGAQKGINIVKYSDGSAQKVLVK